MGLIAPKMIVMKKTVLSNSLKWKWREIALKFTILQCKETEGAAESASFRLGVRTPVEMAGVVGFEPTNDRTKTC